MHFHRTVSNSYWRQRWRREQKSLCNIRSIITFRCGGNKMQCIQIDIEYGSDFICLVVLFVTLQ